MPLLDPVRFLISLLAFLSVSVHIVNGLPHLLSPRSPTVPPGHWIDTWAAMPQLTEPANLPPAPFNQTDVVFSNTTIRQTILTTIGSSTLRLRISNAFGTTPLNITSATIALPLNGASGSSAVDPSTLQSLTFSGSPNFSLPAGALEISDPIFLSAPAHTVLSVSLYLAGGQQGHAITSHPGSRTTSWLSIGDQTHASNTSTASTRNVTHWYFVSALEAWVPRSHRTLAIIGDSLTDGRGTDTDANNRWPDLLFARLQNISSSNTTSPLTTLAIANLAAGGNRVLHDSLGPSALARLDRDVLSHAGTAYMLLFTGINDVGTAAATRAAQRGVAAALIAAYRQLIARGHAAGLPVFGATLTPFCARAGGAVQPYSDPERERARREVNAWIRDGGAFDAVVDFDAVVRDPRNGSVLRREWDAGDGLHLNALGYRAMAEAFPVGVFGAFEGGVGGFV